MKFLNKIRELISIYKNFDEYIMDMKLLDYYKGKQQKEWEEMNEQFSNKEEMYNFYDHIMVLADIIKLYKTRQIPNPTDIENIRQVVERNKYIQVLTIGSAVRLTNPLFSLTEDIESVDDMLSLSFVSPFTDSSFIEILDDVSRTINFEYKYEMDYKYGRTVFKVTIKNKNKYKLLEDLFAKINSVILIHYGIIAKETVNEQLVNFNEYLKEFLSLLEKFPNIENLNFEGTEKHIKNIVLNNISFTKDIIAIIEKETSRKDNDFAKKFILNKPNKGAIL